MSEVLAGWLGSIRCSNFLGKTISTTKPIQKRGKPDDKLVKELQRMILIRNKFLALYLGNAKGTLFSSGVCKLGTEGHQLGKTIPRR